MSTKNNKPVRRISDANKIPLENFKTKELKPTQVISPNLTPEEKKLFQEKLNEHSRTFVEHLLERGHRIVEQHQALEDARIERELEEEDAKESNKYIKELLASRPDSNSAIQKKFMDKK